MARGDPTGYIAIHTDEQTEEDFRNLCDKRGLYPEQMFRVMLRGYAKRQVNFDLQDELTFGKYNGLRLEEVIRADPRYITWLLGESTWFRISDRAKAILTLIEDAD
jgi:hypothetical protein